MENVATMMKKNKVEESIEIWKILGLINNIEKHQIKNNHFKEKKRKKILDRKK